MTRWWPLAVLLALLAMLVSPRIASASRGVQPETRVRGFDLVALPLVGLLAAPSTEKHEGNSVAYDETARGYSLAAEGIGGAATTLEGTALRAESALQGSLLRQQLAAEEIAGARLPSGISGYTIHGLDQAVGRDGVGVAVGAIRDAVSSPLSIYGRANGTFGFVGADATVILNPNGQIVSTWATSSAGFRIPLPF